MEIFTTICKIGTIICVLYLIKEFLGATLLFSKVDTSNDPRYSEEAKKKEMQDMFAQWEKDKYDRTYQDNFIKECVNLLPHREKEITDFMIKHYKENYGRKG